jgi:hypothetical protein
VTVVSNTSAATSAAKSITATCTGGRKVVGGGFSASSANVGASASFASSATVWTVDGSEFVNTASTWTITAYALCAL